MTSWVKETPLFLKRGDDYNNTVYWTDLAGDPVDLTGAAVYMDIKSAIDIEPPLVSLIEGAGLTLDGPAGSIRIDISGSQTLLLNESNVYDLQVKEASGDKTTIMGGNLAISKDVTVLA